MEIIAVFYIIKVMEKFKKAFMRFFIVLFICTFFIGILASPHIAYGQVIRGVLPVAPADCDSNNKEWKNNLKDEQSFDKYVNGERGKLSDALGCAIKTGRISMFMIPYFVTFLIQFLLGISGMIAVIFVIIGGYNYVVGGITEEKEKGKKTIQNALIGLIVALCAWIVVNFVQMALTS